MADDLTTRFGLTAEDLARYEAAGIIRPIRVDGSVYLEGNELRLQVIAIAQELGFSFDEIVAMIRYGMT